jgi:hypothetical protein
LSPIGYFPESSHFFCCKTQKLELIADYKSNGFDCYLFSALRASALFGSVTASTPFLKLALILSASWKGPLERAEATLTHGIAFLLSFSLFLLLSLNRQHTAANLTSTFFSSIPTGNSEVI